MQTDALFEEDIVHETTPELYEEAKVIVKKMIHEYGDATVKSWISPLVFDKIKDTRVCYTAPSRFMRDWILNNYSRSLLKYWRESNPDLSEVVIDVSSNRIPNLEIIQPAKKNIELNFTASNDFGSTDSFDDDDLLPEEDFAAALDARFTFENFIVGKPNELAYAAALRVAESDKPLYNPLFLHGGVGLGKTHLMHAIAWRIKECHPDRKVIYLSAEKFMYQFIRALRYKDTVSFKERFRNVDVLMIDDVQFIGGKDTTQEEFFHTFNALVDNNHQVIISADKSPSDLEKIGDRLKSRLSWGLVADIHPTTYELRLGILQAKAESMRVKVPKEVLEFLAFKISSNIRELEGSLNRIVAHSTLIGRAITIDTTHDVLKDVLRANDRRVTADDIQKRVCDFYNIKLSDMQSSKRTQAVAKPRQVAMYLTKILTSKSLPDIGRMFGGKDHTTVLHSIRKVEAMMKDDRELSNNVETLRRCLEN
jgi:chromosomal replication initiator protein